MAGVKLYLRTLGGNPVLRFVRPGGALDALPVLRLFAYVDLRAHVQLGSGSVVKAAHPDCVVDTGSPLSVLPEYIWSRFRPGAVTPLPFDPALPQVRRFLTVGGGRYPFELGELDICLRDLDGRTMSLRAVAQLTRDNGALQVPMLLGLSGGVIDGRILRSEPDAAAPFGQAWALEDP